MSAFVEMNPWSQNNSLSYCLYKCSSTCDADPLKWWWHDNNSKQNTYLTLCGVFAYFRNPSTSTKYLCKVWII